MVAVLVGDDVALGEWPALRAEAALEVLEEAEVEVDLPVERTVEGALRRRRVAARGVCGAGEEHGLGGGVLPTALLELAGPVRLDAVGEADDAAVGARVRIGASTALLRALHAGNFGLLLLWRGDGVGIEPHVGGVDAEQHGDDGDDESDTATTGDDRPGHPTTAATILDLAGVESCVGIKHSFTSV